MSEHATPHPPCEHATGIQACITWQTALYAAPALHVDGLLAEKSNAWVTLPRHVFQSQVQMLQLLRPPLSGPGVYCVINIFPSIEQILALCQRSREYSTGPNFLSQLLNPTFFVQHCTSHRSDESRFGIIRSFAWPCWLWLGAWHGWVQRRP